MCTKFVQYGQIVKPGQPATVLMSGPSGTYEVYHGAIFGGPARRESLNYWIKREGAEPVIVPGIERYEEKSKATGDRIWEDVAKDSEMEGLLLPVPPGKDYRLLKVVTQEASAEQFDRSGNDRAPVFRP